MTVALYNFQGLVLSKQKSSSESSNNSSLTQETTSMPVSAERIREDISKVEEETCPICQEKLKNHKMVFQCGHFTCCKCKSPIGFFFVNIQYDSGGTQYYIGDYSNDNYRSVL